MSRTPSLANFDLEIGELSLGGLDPQRRRVVEQHIREAIASQLAARPVSARHGIDLSDLHVRVRHSDDGPAIGRRVAEALMAAVHRDREVPR